MTAGPRKLVLVMKKLNCLAVELAKFLNVAADMFFVRLSAHRSVFDTGEISKSSSTYPVITAIHPNTLTVNEGEESDSTVNLVVKSLQNMVMKSIYHRGVIMRYMV